MGPRPWAVAVVLFVCGAAGAGRLLLLRAPGRGPVEMVAEEIVRCANGQAVLVLRAKGGELRLPMPVSAQEAVALEQRLRGTPREELAAASIHALGGRVLGVSIDAIESEHVFRGHLTVATGAGRVELAARPQESIGLALDARAPILVAPEVLDEAAVSDGELRSLHELDRARSISSGREPVPLLKI